MMHGISWRGERESESESIHTAGSRVTQSCSYWLSLLLFEQHHSHMLGECMKVATRVQLARITVHGTLAANCA